MAPRIFTDVKMIVSKKNQKATKCSDNCTIRLITHTAKIVARILRRIERNFDDIIGEVQFGFTRGKGTGGALGC